MHLASQPEESTEAHDQRTPEHRVNMRTQAVAHEKLFVDVQLHDMHLEHIRAHVLAEGTVIVHDALHVHGTLAHARRRH